MATTITMGMNSRPMHVPTHPIVKVPTAFGMTVCSRKIEPNTSMPIVSTPIKVDMALRIVMPQSAVKIVPATRAMPVVGRVRQPYPVIEEMAAARAVTMPDTE